MIKITKAPQQVQVRQSFTISGTASPELVGKTVILTVDNQFRSSSTVVNANGSWEIGFVFLQPGERRLTISIGDFSETIPIKVIVAIPRLRFTNVPNPIRAEEPFIITGEADDFADGEELEVMVDDDFEVARPRVRNERWQATLLFHQAGRRKLEVLASEQERAEIEINVLPAAELEIYSRQFWGARSARREIPNLMNPRRITIHHTFLPAEPAIGQTAEIQRMRQIQNGHMSGSQNFSDIGYHYVIMASGRVYEGRQERKRGSHDNINDGIGICFDGDYTNRQITNEQFRSAVILCTKLCQRMGVTDPVTPVSTRTTYSGNPTRMIPPICAHRDRVPTTCPGVDGGRTVRLADIRQAVKQALERK
jgi:hypothetical protein